MAKRKKANPWDEVFERIDVHRRPDSLYLQLATEAELDEAEAQLGLPLPASYREFMFRFGPGRIHDWVDVYGVTPTKTRFRSSRTIVEETPEAFPILADALEEAGCTNADLLESCRRGDPDIDGVWVLRVLLGTVV